MTHRLRSAGGIGYPMVEREGVSPFTIVRLLSSLNDFVKHFAEELQTSVVRLLLPATTALSPRLTESSTSTLDQTLYLTLF